MSGFLDNAQRGLVQNPALLVQEEVDFIGIGKNDFAHKILKSLDLTRPHLGSVRFATFGVG